MTVKKGGTVSINSTCPYHYEKMSYKAALEPTKTNPSTNIPIHCQLCPPLAISGEPRTIWKYNSIYHLLSEHSPEYEDNTDDNSEKTTLPKIPGQMTVDMFISRKEEVFLKITPQVTTQYREKYENIPDSDGVELIKEELKRDRAQTLSVVEPGGKRRRK